MVIGGGPIGNLTAQVARLYRPGKVVVLERNAFRREVLRKLGFDARGGSSEEDAAALRESFGGHGPDIVFECAGSEAATDLAITTVRRGGHVVIVGVYGSPPKVKMILVQDKEITMKGSLMYTWDDYHDAVAFVERQRVDLKILQTHHVPFSEWADGYRLLMDDTANVLKVLVDL